VSKLSMRAMAIETFVAMLRTLTYFFEKAEEHALTKKVDIAGLKTAPRGHPHRTSPRRWRSHLAVSF
jgi:hypothetical protein